MVELRIQRAQARQAGDQQQRPAPFERLAQRADGMAKTSAALKKIADAGTPLYQSLNDDQKNRFVILARMLRSHHGMRGDHEHGWRNG
jgi:zinc resistance-associated protein